METEAECRERRLRRVFALLMLAVPAVMIEFLFLQWHLPVPEFRMDALGQGLVLEVIPGGGAEAAGVRAGDAVLAVNGVPLQLDGAMTRPPAGLQVGQIATLGIERDGRRLELDVPLVPVAKVTLPELISAVDVALTFWIASILLLWRRFRRVEVRLLFLLAQAIAIGVLFPPLGFITWYSTSAIHYILSFACVGLSAPLLFHYHITFPVVLGSRRQRRRALGAFYGVVLVGAVAYLISQSLVPLAPMDVLVIQVDVLCFVLQVCAAIAVTACVYFRRASPDGRRRLRVIFFGVALAAGVFIALYALPAVIRGSPLVPEWLVWSCLLVAPLSYAYATVRHNLFGIDRVLNRATLYLVLSLGVFALYLGPFLLLYRFVHGDLLLQMTLVAGVTALEGLTFDWTRARAQHLVDRLFYGGWYDYPGVVERVSDALARALDRSQLAHVLTRQVPELMRLRGGELWVGEREEAPQRGVAPPQVQFPLPCEGEVCGLWTVGARRDGEDFTRADRRILRTLARQAEIAFRNVLLVEALRDQLHEIHASHETLAKAQRRLLRSREEERGRLARDLHDGPIQALVGLKVQMGLLLASAPEGHSAVRDALTAIRAEVQGLLDELRQVCADLRPPMLDTLGLGAALRALAAEWPSQSEATVALELPPDAMLRSLPVEVAVNLYRVAQEGLNNAARHAAARHLTIRLAWEAATLVLTLRDDGQGFTVPDALEDLVAQGRFGLAGMRERVELIGGTLALDSAPGEGTTVRVAWQQPGA
jgi:two-component system NarL family sensor kinase